MAKTMIDLDDRSSIASVDRAEMLSEIEGFHRQCEEAVDVGRRANLKVTADGVRDIVVLGMGGSGVSGDVCRVLFDDDLPVPLSVNRYYRLPAYVGKKTLVLAASYSGNTEETLEATSEAYARGARVAVISSGGKLSQMARDNDLTLISIPPGKQPRASLGYLSLPLAVLMERLGLAPDLSAAIQETIALVREIAGRYGGQAPESANPAKRLARRLFGRMPVVYGSEGVTGLAAFRFKCQINENSKSPAQFSILPELDHNEITGWQLLAEITRHFHLIFLRDKDEHPQVAKRVQVTRDLIVQQFGGADEFHSQGDSKLARLFSLICLGDFVSFYLAVLNEIDPSPVERIELLKKRLA